MTEWYKLDEKERIEQIYSKYSVKDFWDWWVGNESKVMEVRIKDFNLIKSISKKYNLPYSASGIYVWSYEQLKIIMKEVRDKATIWFGINCRKKNWNKYGIKTFGGLDTNVRQIDVLFIDIDRIKKEGIANKYELENCDILANHIIEKLSVYKWANNYCKICSGNGVQLIFKLDVPIKMPEVEYVNKTQTTPGYYANNEEFEKLKRLIPEGIGTEILKFSKTYRKELEVEVDKSCFNIGRVAALPFTKNFKYGGFTWRGIIHLENKINDGLSDYIISKEKNSNTKSSYNVFPSKSVQRRDKINKENIRENILIKYMLENELPAGMRNNYLWFSVKCLLRDSNIDFNSDEFRALHKELEAKHGSLPANIPEDRFKFDENIVNKYFIINLLTPIYPIYPHKTKKLDMKIDTFRWSDIDNYNIIKTIPLTEQYDIMEDITYFRYFLKEGDMSNVDKFAAFLRSCISKYDEKTTKYFFDYVMLKILSYD